MWDGNITLRLSTCDYSSSAAFPVGVSIIANIYFLVTPLEPPVIIVWQVIRLLAILFIILDLYICLILVHPRVHWTCY
jgi:hypothetical protein